nr:hypothetical protein [Candidatus Brocadiales bacterium]
RVLIPSDIIDNFVTENPQIIIIEPNAVIKPALEKSTAQIGITKIQNLLPGELPVTGKGFKVAVIDTGIDRTHHDIADRIVSQIVCSDIQQDGTLCSTDLQTDNNNTTHGTAMHPHKNNFTFYI